MRLRHAEALGREIRQDAPAGLGRATYWGVADALAAHGLTRSAALALAPHGVRVNAVCPGVLPTAMTEEIDRDRARLLGLAAGEPTRRAVATVPLGRAARLEEVAEMVAFLASDRAAYVTGQAVNVCGGLEMD